MKRFVIILLLGVMIISSFAQAKTYNDGDTMPCGKIYYNTMLRGDTRTNAMNLMNSNGSGNGADSYSGNSRVRSRN